MKNKHIKIIFADRLSL